MLVICLFPLNNCFYVRWPICPNGWSLVATGIGEKLQNNYAEYKYKVNFYVELVKFSRILTSNRINRT